MHKSHQQMNEELMALK